MKYLIIKHGIHKVYYTAEYQDGNVWKALQSETLFSSHDIHFSSARKAERAILAILNESQRAAEDRRAKETILEKEI